MAYLWQQLRLGDARVLVRNALVRIECAQFRNCVLEAARIARCDQHQGGGIIDRPQNYIIDMPRDNIWLILCAVFPDRNPCKHNGGYLIRCQDTNPQFMSIELHPRMHIPMIWHRV